MSLPRILSHAKDKVAQIGIRFWFRFKLKRLGNMTSLQIDSNNKTIRIELELKGESAPITVNIGRYELSEQGGKTYLRLDGIQTSREWINILLDQYLKRRSFEVPEVVKLAL